MAVEYYVDPSGTDDGSHGTGTGIDAWATIEHAVSSVANPDSATIVIHVSGDTYTLNSNSIYIDRSFTNLTIQGAGVGTTIVQAHATEGSATDRVFRIRGSDENVTLKDMTIRNGNLGIGYAGGGIDNEGILTLTNCTVSGNSAHYGGGGIWNGGTLTLTDCTVSGNTSNGYGGGINNAYGSSTLTLTNCTVSGNTSESYSGGGINNEDTLTLTNCTVSGNTAEGSGGGIFNEDILTLTNCTVSENTAVVGYGGGVELRDTGNLYIKNTIVANNTAGADGDDFSSSNAPTLHSNGYNIVEDISYSNNTTGTFNGTGDITGEQANLNLSSTLEDNNTSNGTQTLKTTSGSVAINAGSDSGANNGVAIPTQDQRGANRNGTTDIGAYEYWDDGGSLPVELSSFTATTCDGKVTLRWRTESEINNVGFSIYRSEEKDGKYNEVAFVKGAGNTGRPTDYQYVDEMLLRGKTYYYYIADVDLMGNAGKSHIIIIKVIDDAKNKAILPKLDSSKWAEEKVGILATPLRTALRPNFPNPFNPETWLPYQLSDDSPVIIRIYDVRGRVIHVLNLGKQDAGYYLSKGKAAYWDGKNATGQTISSGVYFYQLQAGNFSAVRRMVILN